MGKSSAIFSKDRNYRWLLTREWRPGGVDQGNVINWLMLNPSTATAKRNDPTIRRCIGYSRLWGYDGCFITNIFGIRSPEPKDLFLWDDPVGGRNDYWIEWAANQCKVIVCAWGANGRYFTEREEQIHKLLASHTLSCLGYTKGEHPLHPLMQPVDAELVPYPRSRH